MIQVPDFIDARVEEVFVHFSGNFAKGRPPEFELEPVRLEDPLVNDFFISWLSRPYKTDQTFKFRNTGSSRRHIVMDLCIKYFKKKNSLHVFSREITEHIHRQMCSAEIPEGEVLVCEVSQIRWMGQSYRAIAILKVDNKNPFLVLGRDQNKPSLEAWYGLYLKKPCKSALVFYDEVMKDFFVMLHDDTRYDGPAGGYWGADVMDVEPMEGNYFFTDRFLKMAKKYGDEVLNEDNQIDPLDKNIFLHRNLEYFKNHATYEPKTYEQEVLPVKELRDSFHEFARSEDPDWDKFAVRDFDVSGFALKKNQRFFKSVIKLDSNFHIYAHGRYDLVEKGFDEEKGMKYYKLYYETEH
ncbi:MAG: nucleoid-associated protein [Bacteroidia bacterium]|nr:nucleoid-associated protein [Bacteroidia bacterium]